MRKYNKNTIEQFFKAILSLENIEECHSFFDDACTIQEIEAISQRFDVACKLAEGKNYQEVNKLTGVSTATITRVNKCLNYGDGGYNLAIKRMKEKNN